MSSLDEMSPLSEGLKAQPELSEYWGKRSRKGSCASALFWRIAVIDEDVPFRRGSVAVLGFSLTEPSLLLDGYSDSSPSYRSQFNQPVILVDVIPEEDFPADLPVLDHP